MKLIQTSLLALATMVSISALAASEQNYCGTSAIVEKGGKDTCKNIPSNRRQELGKHVAGGNPVAITNDEGKLTVYYTVGGADLKACDITANVKEFKMSQNPGDMSTTYFVKDNGDLFDAKMRGAVSASECPKASTQNYSAAVGITGNDDVVDMTLASNSKSAITMAARTKSNMVIFSTDTNIGRKGPYASAKDAKAAMKEMLGN